MPGRHRDHRQPDSLAEGRSNSSACHALRHEAFDAQTIDPKSPLGTRPWFNQRHPPKSVKGRVRCTAERDVLIPLVVPTPTLRLVRTPEPARHPAVVRIVLPTRMQNPQSNILFYESNNMGKNNRPMVATESEFVQFKFWITTNNLAHFIHHYGWDIDVGSATKENSARATPHLRIPADPNGWKHFPPSPGNHIPVH